MLIKTSSGLFGEQLAPSIQEQDPDQLPEIIALPILVGGESYLNWIIKETRGE